MTTIFWSWQSDTDPKIGRYFVREALAEAIEKVGEELGLEEADRPELDHDTKGTPGLAEITPIILAKIKACATLVADVTPIARSASGKALPNPNVMIELGWGLAHPGWERVIAVMNDAEGWKVEELPFDLRHRRILTFTLKADAPKAAKASEKAALVAKLSDALRLNLSEGQRVADENIAFASVEGKAGNPSIWAQHADGFEHFERLGRDWSVTLKIPDRPRAYIRVIPAGWKNLPVVEEIAKLPHDKAVWPAIEGGGNGSSGHWELGYVNYWLTEKSEDSKVSISENVACYFDKTGEFWVLHGTAFHFGEKETWFMPGAAIRGWNRVIVRATGVLAQLDARKPTKIIVGIEGAKGARLPSQLSFDVNRARGNALRLERVSRGWDDEARLLFMEEALTGVRNLFGLSRPTRDDLLSTLKGQD